MQPIDFRNENFESLRGRLTEQREKVYRAWLAHGPGTTRDVAAKAQIDLLSFRPRTTELYQLGLVMLIEPGEEIHGTVPCADGSEVETVSIHHQAGHEGTYYPRTLEEWELWCEQQILEVKEGQLKMSI